MIDVQQEIIPEEAYPNMATWIEFGQSIVKEHSPVQWEIGRWLVTGENLYGKKAYREAESLTGYSRRTLYDLVWVVRQVSLRNEDLSWSHHKAVAHLAKEKQLEWLDRAHLGNLTVRQLRSSIRHEVPMQPKARWTTEKLETERSLRLLAISRGTTIQALKQAIFYEYLERPEIIFELEIAKCTARDLARENRQTARERWREWVTVTIERLLSQLEEGASGTDPTDFVVMWERETNRKFTRQVFIYAMRYTELRAHYAGMSSEDFGLDIDPAVHVHLDPIRN
jgi:hypothetical protein